MRASRVLTLSLAVLLASAASLTYTAPAQANDTRVRITVDLGDIFYASGRPYYRYDRQPVYSSYDRWGHRTYYRYAPPPRYVVYGGRDNGRWDKHRYRGHDRGYDRDHRRGRDDDRRGDRRW